MPRRISPRKLLFLLISILRILTVNLKKRGCAGSAKRREVVTSDDDLIRMEAVSRGGLLEQYVATEVMQNFKDNCDDLPEPYRTPAKLYFEEGLTAREISERSKEPLKTVQSHIYRAREMLKKKIRKEDLLT